MKGFWEVIDRQIAELETAATADEVLSILSKERNPYGDPSMAAGEGFFAGSGGDKTVYGALSRAGWSTGTFNAPYFYTMVAPNGDVISYVEGDIYRGDRVNRSKTS